MKFARFLLGLPLAAAAFLVLAATPEARAAIYVCTNSEIPGDVTAEGFQDCIEVLSFGEAIQMPLDATTGGASRTTGNPVASPFRLIKPLDRTSPVWRDRLLTGTAVGEVTVAFVTVAGDGALRKYFEVRLGSAVVTELSMTADGSGVPTEVISLDALQVDWTFTRFDNTGNPQGNVPASWNFSTGSKI